MHIFDHTVKPVLLYASEIVGLFNNNKNVGVNSNNDSHFISNLMSKKKIFYLFSHERKKANFYKSREIIINY
jgi:hypothetical protein